MTALRQRAPGILARFILLGTASILCSVVTTACDESDPKKHAVAALEQEVVQRAISVADQSASHSQVIREVSPYLGDVGTIEAPEPDFPAGLEGPDGFALTTHESISPASIAERITQATGIQVVTDIGLPGSRARIDEGSGAIRYRGSLSGFLNLLGNRWDAGWWFRDGVVRFSDRVFRTYPVRASVAQSNLSLETAESGAESGSLSTGVRLESAAWQEIDANLASIVDRGHYNLSPGAGLVSVQAPPSVHAAVDAYLTQANEVFDTRIAIEVAAAFLDVTDLEEYGLSLTFLASLLDGEADIRVGRDSGTDAPAIATFTILESATGGLARHIGTSAMLRALSRTNRVIDYRTANALTRHGSPVPIRLSRRRDIVRRISVTVEGDNSTTAIESEPLDTGLSISAHPRLLDPGKVHLTLSVAARDLVSLEPFQSSGNSTVQLATVDERRLTHDLVIGNDELVILAGYEQRRSGRLGAGVGAPEFVLLGGSRKEEIRRSRLYLFVSARAIQ